MTDAGVVERNGQYAYASLSNGVSEERTLDFHSPYGCSKGAADQYVIDYHRIYGLATTVLRQSCIYGYRQFGAEDQGWIAWFMIAAQLGHPITVFGDGKQVRDILFVDDLLDAYDAVFQSGENVWGRAYNIGGGPTNVLSLLELLSYIEKRKTAPVNPTFAAWRPGDQRVFVSDIRRAQIDFGWAPRIPYVRGLDLLYEWVGQNLHMFDGGVGCAA
jgi:CDP-paratose 2-epimerase